MYEHDIKRRNNVQLFIELHLPHSKKTKFQRIRSYVSSWGIPVNVQLNITRGVSFKNNLLCSYKCKRLKAESRVSTLFSTQKFRSFVKKKWEFIRGLILPNKLKYFNILHFKGKMRCMTPKTITFQILYFIIKYRSKRKS
jgi:hypothetical protein